MGNFIRNSSAAGFALEPTENSESGQNPERYRHCMRGGAAQDESQSLGFFLRRQCGRLMIRKSGDLLEYSLCAFCVIMEWTVVYHGKTAMSAICWHGFFVLIGGLLIAVCRPLLIILPRNAETFAPVPVTPFGNREAKKELHRLLDEEESK